MLLKNVLGTGPKTKYGSLSGKLGKAVEKIEGQKAVGGFNFSYRDTGLAGALITCESGIAGHVSTVTKFFIWSFSEIEAYLTFFLKRSGWIWSDSD